jgi:hypothetical protein
MMNKGDRQLLRDRALAALNASRMEPNPRSRGWELQTSNSFRRIGMHGDGDVLVATTHPVDRHPDLSAPPGVLEYIVVAQPRFMLELLDQLDMAELLLSRLSEVDARLDDADRKFREAQVLIEQMRDAMKALTR